MLHQTGALELCQSIDDAGARARAEWFLGFVACDLGNLSVSEELVNRALRTARAISDRWCVAAALSTRAKQAMLRGDLAEVERSGAQSLEMFSALGDRWGQLQSTEWLGALARIRGDYQRATGLHRDGLRMAEELGLWPQAADQLSWLGRIAMHLGDYAQARDLHERAMRLAARHSYTPGETFAEFGLGLLARREGRLDAAEAHLRSVLERSRPFGAMPGVGVTLSLVELGFVAEQRGDATGAQTLHLDGLAASRKLGDLRAMALALEGLAGARALAGYHGQAARLLGMADAARRSAGAPLPPAEQGDIDRITAMVRPTVGEEAFASEFAVGANLDPHDALGWMSPPPRGPRSRRRARRSSHP
jgi:tetratricopeptide (TPR) repeat protein